MNDPNKQFPARNDCSDLSRRMVLKYRQCWNYFSNMPLHVMVVFSPIMLWHFRKMVITWQSFRDW